MHILALETTAMTGSIAAYDGAQLLVEIELPPQQRSAQSLAPAIVQLLHSVGWKPQDVQLVAVTVGPGSFTGLRVGVTTAKTFAYAVGATVLGIDTLETIAAGVAVQNKPALVPTENRTSPRLHIVMDAQRGDLITQSFYLASDGWFRPDNDQKLLPAEQWLKGLTPGDMIAGPVLGQLQASIPPTLIVLPEALWHPRARHVARLAARDNAAGRRDDLWRLVPRYSRRSAAEERAAPKL
jgi:tRNA threonylcarbamoyladenosine biosynthesis protein TsaB